MFICLSCSGIHRNIPQVSKVKSVRLDTWEPAQVEVGPGGQEGTLGACPEGQAGDTQAMKRVARGMWCGDHPGRVQEGGPDP